MTTQQSNFRLPDITLEQIDQICETYGMTKTQALILAVDRLARDLYPPKADMVGRAAKTEAHLLAENGDESGTVEQA